MACHHLITQLCIFQRRMRFCSEPWQEWQRRWVQLRTSVAMFQWQKRKTMSWCPPEFNWADVDLLWSSARTDCDSWSCSWQTRAKLHARTLFVHPPARTGVLLLGEVWMLCSCSQSLDCDKYTLVRLSPEKKGCFSNKWITKSWDLERDVFAHAKPACAVWLVSCRHCSKTLNSTHIS